MEGIIEHIIIPESMDGGGVEKLQDAQSLLVSFRSAVQEIIDVDDVGILFSGGLDSTIVAILAAEKAHVTLYTVGVEGSYDLEAGRSAAEFLSMEWVPVTITQEDVMGAIREMIHLTDIRSPVTLSFMIPMYFVSKSAAQELLLSGQGADELFAGYARYSAMSMEEKALQMETDMAKLMDQTIDNEQCVSNNHGKRLRYPFLHPQTIDTVNAVPVDRRVGNENTKELLREVARLLEAGGLAERKKKAAQYGSGAMRSLKSYARGKGMTVRGLVNELYNEGRGQ